MNRAKPTPETVTVRIPFRLVKRGGRKEVQLPDGGRAVTDANDHGEPLGKAAPKSPLRKAISKLARVVAAVETAGRATA